MAEIINLNQARKLKQKAEKQAKTAENSRIFGLNKVEKAQNKADKKLERSKLDGLRIYNPDRKDDQGDDDIA